MIGDFLRVTDPTILEGWISVLAALTSHSRPVYQILLQRNKVSPQRPLIERAAQADGVPVRHVDATVIAAHAAGATHGGVVAVAGPRRTLSLDQLGTSVERPFIVMLDGIEDPYNFGQAVRVLYAAGVHGLVVRPRSWLASSGTVVRASAGATERLPVAEASSPVEAIAHFKARGLTIACTGAAAAAHSLYQVDLTGPLFLVIGGEKRGIARPLWQAADLLLRIPYEAAFDHSLGAAAATAIISFEVLRQRRATREGDLA
jgi:23S rRNA (guanosine2251-2'-O)-methyltransferase